MKFKLQFYLDSKEAELSKVLMELAEIQRRISLGLNLLEENRSMIEQVSQSKRASVFAWQIQYAGAAIKSLEKRKADIMQKLKLLERDRIIVQEKYNNLRAEIKMLEKMKEKQKAEFKKLMEKKELQRLNEFSILSLARSEQDEH